jgi:hypothetical protein
MGGPGWPLTQGVSPVPREARTDLNQLTQRPDRQLL